MNGRAAPTFRTPRGHRPSRHRGPDIPFLSLRLGFSDAGNEPTSNTSRRVYGLLAQGFGPGFNGAPVFAADRADSSAQAGFASVLEKVARTRRRWGMIKRFVASKIVSELRLNWSEMLDSNAAIVPPLADLRSRRNPICAVIAAYAPASASRCWSRKRRSGSGSSPPMRSIAPLIW
jgi:hypothetical protein